MSKKKFLMTTIVSTLLLSNTISAQTIKCKDGKCFIDISKFTQSKNIVEKASAFKNLKKSHLTTSVTNNSSTGTIVLDHSKYIMNENEKENYLLDNLTLYDAEDTIVFEHSKYVMSEREKEAYYMNQRLKKAELEKEVIVPTITIENQDTKEILLPHSELYCDNSKQAKFYPESNEYECV